MSALRAGVLGAGVFGRHHARKYAGDGRVGAVWVHDPDAARAAALAEEAGARLAPSLAALLAEVDVLTIASPPSAHAAAAAAALAAGVHVLVEKPLATTVADGEALVAAAAARGLTLACGHQERLVFQAMGLFAAPERPVRIEAERAGPWTGRSADVSVTLDLLVHDADLACQLLGAAPSAVTATGRTVHGAPFDEIDATAVFAGGAEVRLAASRLREARARTMRIVYPAGEVQVDFIARTFADTTGFGLNPDFAATPAGQDPLGANVAAFLDAVTGAAPRPAVTGAEALAALRLALAIDAAAGR